VIVFYILVIKNHLVYNLVNLTKLGGLKLEREIITDEAKKKKPFLFKLGIGLLILYPILWGAAAIVPFTPFPTHIKATFMTLFIVLGEILCLLGIALVGKEVVTKYKSKLNPKNWRRRGDQQNDE